MNWEIVLSLLSGLGGLEALKWWLNRKSEKRLASARADGEVTAVEVSREHLWQETVTFLQNQLKEKEERFAAQTSELRSTTAEVIALTRKVGELEIRHLSTRCDRIECRHRTPPLPWEQPRPAEGDDEAKN